MIKKKVQHLVTYRAGAPEWQYLPYRRTAAIAGWVATTLHSDIPTHSYQQAANLGLILSDQSCSNRRVATVLQCNIVQIYLSLFRNAYLDVDNCSIVATLATVLVGILLPALEQCRHSAFRNPWNMPIDQ